jgi:hypothetical protein
LAGLTVRFDLEMPTKSSTVVIAAILVTAILPAQTGTARIVCALGPGAADYNSYNSNKDQRPTNDAMQLAQRMNAAMAPACSPNCPQIAIYRNATAANAMLVAINDQAKFVYAPQFFTTVYEKFGDGAIIAIIAHEFGHALDDTLGAVWVKKDWTPEVRADSWAGCILARVNLSPADLDGALTALSKYAPPSQPNWNLRLPAIRTGYTHCGGDGAGFDGSGKKRS